MIPGKGGRVPLWKAGSEIARGGLARGWWCRGRGGHAQEMTRGREGKQDMHYLKGSRGGPAAAPLGGDG
jgi:hypothetical protein